VFNDDSIVINNELSAKDLAEWDSMNHVNIIIAVEAEFNIRFSNDEISELKNVGELIDLIKNKTD
jgi:acyl carrier protein